MENKRPPGNNSSPPQRQGRTTQTPDRTRGEGFLPRDVRSYSSNDRNSGFGNDRTGGRPFYGNQSRSVGGPRYAAGVNRSSRKQLQPAVAITSDLQVTDGKLRGRVLRNSTSANGVPTARQLRELMFRILARRIRAGRFLDLCAGCGTIGIEAISRGAMLATFVERSSRMASHLRHNLKDIGIHENRGQVMEIEAIPYLVRCSRRKRVWDVVYMGRLDDMASAELAAILGRGRVIARGGVAVIEHASAASMPETLGVLRQWRTVERDGWSLSFYNR